MKRELTDKLNKNVVSLPSKPAGVAKAALEGQVRGEGAVDVSTLRDMIDNAPYGLMVHEWHRLLYVNTAWAALHGLTVEEAMTKHTIIDLIHESDRDRLVKYKDARYAGGDVPDRYRYRALHKDGRAIWLEHFVKLIDWDGRKAIMVTVIDVDDQERTADALRRLGRSMKEEVRERSKALVASNQQLYMHQSIIDQMSERISVIDKDYHFLMTNRANAVFRGRPRNQMIGLHIQETLGEEAFEKQAKPALDLAYVGHTNSYEYSGLDPDRRRRDFEVTIEPFRESDGEISGAIVSVRDVTPTKEAARRLRLFGSVIEQVSDRISVIDLDYRYRLTNQANLDFYRCSRDEVLGRVMWEIVGEDLFESSTRGKLDRCFEGETVRGRLRQKNYRRETRIFDSLLEPYREADGTITGAVVTIRDITDAQSMSERLAYQARFDQLTGLPNRQTFERVLEKSIARAVASGRSDVLCFIDLDQFKVVNDTVGHLAGDRLLKQVADLLKQKLREDDVLARFGGDEFVLLLHHCSLRRGKRMAEHLIEAVKALKFIHEGLMFRVGASVGITAVNRHATHAGDVLAQADLACYAAKDSGCNQVQVYKKRDVCIRRRHEEMCRAGGIRAALDNDRFALYGQPIVPTCPEDDRAGHVEILLRMTGEEGEVIEPSAFIPVAERFGFMAELDHWVIRETVRELENPQSALHGKSVSINLSGVTLNDDASLDFVRQALARSGLSPERVSFEITETAAIRDMNRTRAFMQELRDRGCRFALDDFGSGHSSLQYLKRLPVDFLKIDGALIADVARDRASQAMVRAIDQMAKDLGIQTIAEGVESPAIRNRLQDLGIDFVQGYAIGLPTPLLGGGRR